VAAFALIARNLGVEERIEPRAVGVRSRGIRAVGALTDGWKGGP